MKLLHRFYISYLWTQENLFKTNLAQPQDPAAQPYDPSTPLLHKYPEKAIIPKDPCIMIIATLYNIQDMEATKMSIRIKKMWNICNRILLNQKKEQASAICKDVDGPRDI